jgi:hypothetical protein
MAKTGITEPKASIFFKSQIFLQLLPFIWSTITYYDVVRLLNSQKQKLQISYISLFAYN